MYVPSLLNLNLCVVEALLTEAWLWEEVSFIPVKSILIEWKPYSRHIRQRILELYIFLSNRIIPFPLATTNLLCLSVYICFVDKFVCVIFRFHI